MNILVIAAHPDDEVLGCGGAIIRHVKKGDRVTILILTDGAVTRYKKKMIKVLRDSAKKCARTLGADKIIFKDLPNQMLDAIPVTRVIQVIEKVMKKVSPNIVYTHDKGDLNHDHRVAYEATLVATRPIPDMGTRKIFTYFVPSSTEYNDTDEKNIFIPNVFLDIKKEVEAKIEAFSCYKSEARPYPHPRSPEAIRTYAKRWGTQAGLEHAEPFRLIREIR